jgi:hypothetical protein
MQQMSDVEEGFLFGVDSLLLILCEVIINRDF